MCRLNLRPRPKCLVHISTEYKLVIQDNRELPGKRQPTTCEASSEPIEEYAEREGDGAEKCHGHTLI